VGFSGFLKTVTRTAGTFLEDGRCSYARISLVCDHGDSNGRGHYGIRLVVGDAGSQKMQMDNILYD